MYDTLYGYLLACQGALLLERQQVTHQLRYGRRTGPRTVLRGEHHVGLSIELGARVMRALESGAGVRPQGENPPS